jgi:hypothetical protein
VLLFSNGHFLAIFAGVPVNVTLLFAREYQVTATEAVTAISTRSCRRPLRPSQH